MAYCLLDDIYKTSQGFLKCRKQFYTHLTANQTIMEINIPMMEATSSYDKGKTVLQKEDQEDEEEDLEGGLMAAMDKHEGKFEKDGRKAGGDFMLYGDVDDDDDTLELEGLMPEDYALDVDGRKSRDSGGRDAQFKVGQEPMASGGNAGKLTTGRSGSICRTCQGFPKSVINADEPRVFIHRVCKSIGE